MQSMPAKTKTLVAAGAVLVAVIIGVFALMSNRQKDEAPLTNDPAASLDVNNPNTDAVADTDTDTAAPVGGESLTPAPSTEASVPETHMVADGDTLYSIARKYYNDALYADDIQEMNPELTDPNFLTVGMELKLPRPEPAMTDNPTTDSATDSATDSDSTSDSATDGNDSDMTDPQPAE